ncbi:2-C-methyl-D-erythritol 4-phosphate cytidylyltransferase [Microbulbifer sediminum]|uniref:2-C-methyl-D-erythritol 4-phosphate cytidylyltransferase n=1 Tax=Microbulbifer sediminum TaxID=2904250 RepID=UPI001F005B7D
MISGYWVVVPAAGVGKRMGADRPKQYLPLLGRPLLSLTLRNILTWPGLAGVVVAVSDDDPYYQHIPESSDNRVHRATGGPERAHSVLEALNFLAGRVAPETQVLVHDAARPCISLDDIHALLDDDSEPMALLAQRSSDTLKLGKAEGGCERVAETLDRAHIWQAQTPQRAPLGELHRCLRRGLERGEGITDEASALELEGHRPLLVEGRRDNIKVTLPADIPLAEAVLRLRYAATEPRR